MSPATSRRTSRSHISSSIPLDELQKALFKHGQEILADIPNYTKIQPIMQVNEVMAK